MVPRIAEIEGITIAVYYFDHPPPHFHARYAEHEALIAIDGLSTIRGQLPPPMMRRVIRWAAQNDQLLRKCWQQAEKGESFDD
jgi:hypothetical protein